MKKAEKQVAKKVSRFKTPESWNKPTQPKTNKEIAGDTCHCGGKMSETVSFDEEAGTNVSVIECEDCGSVRKEC